MTDISSLVTAARLRQVCPGARADILEALIGDAPREFPAAGLTDHVRIAHFVAQIAAETKGLSRLDEDLFYTTVKRLRQVFRSKFDSDEAARPFLRQPEKLANYVYARKNGNLGGSDGWDFRGSGLIQLTGRSNFADAERATGFGLVADPDMARHADSALKIALAYWTKRGISAVADSDSEQAVVAVTRLVNPALLGLDDRKSYFRKALKAFAPPKSLAPHLAPLLAAASAVAAAGAEQDELSGPQWVGRYPTSRDVADLASPFAENVAGFLAALSAGGGHARISATYRPAQRAYLMHWAWLIAKRGQDPANVTAMPGVPIRWRHPTLAQSRAAARQMVDAYGMAHVAALNSRHTERRAIDMTITWDGSLRIAERAGGSRLIDTQPRNGANAELVAVAAGYGVVKLVTDPPHWSDDGR